MNRIIGLGLNCSAILWLAILLSLIPLYETTAQTKLRKVKSAKTKPTAKKKKFVNSTSKNDNQFYGCFVYGKPINLVKPIYPPQAKMVNASGDVNVQVVIDTEGNVISAQALSGHPLLFAAAVSAARQSKFVPIKIDGQVKQVSGVIVYTFNP